MDGWTAMVLVVLLLVCLMTTSASCMAIRCKQRQCSAIRSYDVTENGNLLERPKPSIQMLSTNASHATECIPCKQAFDNTRRNHLLEDTLTRVQSEKVHAQQFNETGTRKVMKATESAADSLQSPGYYHNPLKCFISEETECAVPLTLPSLIYQWPVLHLVIGPGFSLDKQSAIIIPLVTSVVIAMITWQLHRAMTLCTKLKFGEIFAIEESNDEDEKYKALTDATVSVDTIATVPTEKPRGPLEPAVDENGHPYVLLIHKDGSVTKEYVSLVADAPLSDEERKRQEQAAKREDECFRRAMITSLMVAMWKVEAVSQVSKYAAGQSEDARQYLVKESAALYRSNIQALIFTLDKLNIQPDSTQLQNAVNCFHKMALKKAIRKLQPGRRVITG